MLSSVNIMDKPLDKFCTVCHHQGKEIKGKHLVKILPGDREEIQEIMCDYHYIAITLTMLYSSQQMPDPNQQAKKLLNSCIRIQQDEMLTTLIENDIVDIEKLNAFLKTKNMQYVEGRTILLPI